MTDSLATKEKTANKGAANGYAGLGATSVVPTAQLGSGTANSTTYLRGDNTWATPAGGSSYRTLITLSADTANSHGTANTLKGVGNLSFAVVAGTTYRFSALIAYTSAATTTGSRWTVTGPAVTFLNYTSTYPLTATTLTSNYASAYSIPAASNASSLTAGNVAIISGIVKPSANGTVSIAFASEVLSSAITAKAGSTLEWW
jgi:hypothetical protein